MFRLHATVSRCEKDSDCVCTYSPNISFEYLAFLETLDERVLLDRPDEPKHVVFCPCRVNDVLH